MLPRLSITSLKRSYTDSVALYQNRARSLSSLNLTKDETVGKVHEVLLNEKYFDLISEGKKTVEGRVNKNQYTKIMPLDVIVFSIPGKPDKQMHCLVNSLKHYKTFRDMLLSEGLEKCLPGTKTLEEGETIYHSFPGYKEDAARLGVLAFHVQFIHHLQKESN